MPHHSNTMPLAPTRTEQDALGTVTLPASALYGIQTARAVENLSFSGRSLGSCSAYVKALAAVKRAAAQANRDAGVFDATIGDAIAAATAPLLAGEWSDQFPVDLFGGGGSIGVNMNVNEVIANLANDQHGGRRGAYVPVHPLRHVNASQSTADVCHTAVRIAVLTEWSRLEATLNGTVRTLCGQAAALSGLPTLARTCLQDAVPTTAGALFGGYASLLQRRTEELTRGIDALRAVSLGGTVIGDGAGASPRYRSRVIPRLAEVTGLALVARANLADALQNSDDIAQVSGQLALLAQALIKIADDLRLLASGPRGGFGELSLPHVQAGSSFFAGKSNPVVPETLLQCAFLVLGCDRAVQAALEHGELHLNVFDGLAAVNVLDVVQMLAGALERFDVYCLRGLRANEERCRELASFAKAPT